MKRSLICLTAALLGLTMMTPALMAQQRKGNGAGNGRGPHGAGIQLRGGNQGQAAQLQRGYLRRQPSDLRTTDTNAADLLRMWEEEKLARDVYVSLAKTSRQPMFSNISAAESRHMQAVERLIRAGGANANLPDDAHGVFVSPDYQQLFETLVASGSRSPLDAMMVGAKIEEMDIADLKRLLDATTDPQTRQVLEHLRQGSRNHLAAFASQIAQQGATYKAEFLTQAEFDEIANNAGMVPGNSGMRGPLGRANGARGQGRKGGSGTTGGGFGRGRQGRS